MRSDDIYVVAAVRTAIGSFGGSLKDIPLTQLATAVVQAALERIVAGAYGVCVDCGQPIELQRLLAMPAARRCMACQSAREKTGAGSSAH